MNASFIPFFVSRWVVWPSTLTADSKERDETLKGEGAPSIPSCAFVEPGLRRRLSPLARIALSLAHECAYHLPAVKIVFASRHGDINRTHEMLLSLAHGEELSPTRFSLSVHNAIPGLLSMLRKDTSSTTAVSAGAGSLGAGVLQAALEQMAAPDIPVLLIYADVPLESDFYKNTEDAALGAAIALLFESREPNEADRSGGVSLQMQRFNEPTNTASAFSIKRFMHVLQGRADEIDLPDEQGCWKVSRVLPE